MERTRSLFSAVHSRCLLAVLTVATVTAVPLLIGRAVLDRTVIALCYVVAVGWSSARWGREAGTGAALAAMLAFELFFRAPISAFTVDRLVGWLLLAILLIGANVLASRLQSSLANGAASVYHEYLAPLVQELSMVLADKHTQEAVMHAAAQHFQQLFQASLVQVCLQPDHSSLMAVRAPSDGSMDRKPDRVLPIVAERGQEGQVQIWDGDGWLPPEDSHLFRNLAAQVALAVERTRPTQVELPASIRVVENRVES